jgi:GNAT superfamily N-acetyltransferase
MQFLDIATARRLEAAEEVPQMEIARILQRTHPEIGADVLAIAGGHAIFAGLNSPIGRATGLGFDGPVTAAQLDEIEAFYARHRAPAQVDITPLTDSSLLELVKTRGYTIYELNNVMARRLAPQDRFEENVPGIEFRDCTPADTQLWADTMLRGFFPDGAPEGWHDFVSPMAKVPHSLSMIAWADDRPVAAVGGLISPEHRMVALGGTSTLPEFRGRRIQTAAIGRRLNRALRQGCDLAVVITQGSTTSQRNAERLGFTVAYSKATVGKNTG